MNTETPRPSRYVEPDTMTIPELADRLGISHSKAYEMAQDGTLPFSIIRIGKGMKVSARAYDAWLSQFDYQGGESSEAETDVRL